MSWLLAGCYGLVLITISGALQIRQSPRFIGAQTKQNVHIRCLCSADTVQWFRLNEYDGDRNTAAEVKPGGRTVIQSQGKNLRISDVRVEDKGVYFCRTNHSWGPGTELQVARPFNRSKFQHRTRMKDGLIIFQALLLALCTAALLLRKPALREKRDSDYDEPKDDHIYEGLTAETDGCLYEELGEYTRAEGAEAPWD